MVDIKLSRLSMTLTLPASWRAVISLLQEGGGREIDAYMCVHALVGVHVCVYVLLSCVHVGGGPRGRWTIGVSAP